MKLEKAIEILTELSIPGSPDLNPNDFDAIKLGREALKVIDELRQQGDPVAPGPLPGETK